MDEWERKWNCLSQVIGLLSLCYGLGTIRPSLRFLGKSLAGMHADELSLCGRLPDWRYTHPRTWPWLRSIYCANATGTVSYCWETYIVMYLAILVWVHVHNMMNQASQQSSEWNELMESIRNNFSIIVETWFLLAWILAMIARPCPKVLRNNAFNDIVTAHLSSYDDNCT